MGKLRVRNWDKWQSYRRDRGQPPWIKVHREVMRNVDWVSMTDSQRGQLVAIWLLAADHDGVIPASPQVIKKLCFMDSEPDVELFVSLGFLEHFEEGRQGDVMVTPERRQHDETETETETETDITGHPPPAFDRFWAVYPNKVKKKDAAKVWRSKKLDRLADQLIEDVKKRLAEDGRWLDGFICDPPVYLRGERWNDAIQPKKKTQPEGVKWKERV